MATTENLLDTDISNILDLDKTLLIEELKSHQHQLKTQNELLAKHQIELEFSRNKYFELFEYAPIAYFNLDSKGLITHANRAASQLLLIEKELLKNRLFVRYLSPLSNDLFLQHHDIVLKSQQSVSCEVELLRKDGSIVNAQVDSRAVLNESLNEYEILTFITDISIRKNAELILKSQQTKIFSQDRANTVGEIGLLLANELNSPLTIVGNYVDGCLLRLTPENDKHKILASALKKAKAALDNTFEMLRKMKNFKARRALSLETVNINDFISKTISLFTFEVSSFPVRIFYTPNHELDVIDIDKDQIQQVILNLTRNSFEAMNDAQTIQPRVFIELHKITNDRIEIRVIDNGPGVPRDIRQKLFLEQCTSKPYGIGISLVVCKRIAEAHGGTISFDDKKKHGYFTLQLPLNLIGTKE